MPMVAVRMLRGRSPEQKKKLLEGITRVVRETTGAPLSSIRVWIGEMAHDEFMRAGRLASEEPPPPGDERS